MNKPEKVILTQKTDDDYMMKNVVPSIAFSNNLKRDVPRVDYQGNPLPRIRNLQEAFTEIVASDPRTSVTFHALRQAVVSGAIPSRKVGRRYLIEMKNVYRYFAGESLDDGDSLNRRGKDV